MIMIIQENGVEYIMREQIVSIYHNKKNNEARVLFVSGKETRYSNVKEIRFSD